MNICPAYWTSQQMTITLLHLGSMCPGILIYTLIHIQLLCFSIVDQSVLSIQSPIIPIYAIIIIIILLLCLCNCYVLLLSINVYYLCLFSRPSELESIKISVQEPKFLICLFVCLRLMLFYEISVCSVCPIVGPLDLESVMISEQEIYIINIEWERINKHRWGWGACKEGNVGSLKTRCCLKYLCISILLFLYPKLIHGCIMPTWKNGWTVKIRKDKEDNKKIQTKSEKRAFLSLLLKKATLVEHLMRIKDINNALYD